MKSIFFILFQAVACFVFGQSSGILKVVDKDTILWTARDGNLEIVVVGTKPKTPIALLGNLTQDKVLDIIHNDSVAALISNPFGNEFHYYLFEYKNSTWKIKYYKKWRDVSRFFGINYEESVKDLVESVKLLSIYEVDVIYKHKPINRKYVFSTKGEPQIIETIRK